MAGFPVGKLPAEVLDRLLKKLPPGDPRLVIRPRLGEDAAVIDFGDRFLVAKTDPITFAVDRIGWYAVHINANDIATMGATPKWFLATALLPEGKADETLASSIFEDLGQACEELGVTLCGGHTEITAGLDRPILVGQMLGEVEKSRLVDKREMRPGDVVLLTKGIAIEGTAVLARERAGEVEARFGQAFLRRARDFLIEPGLSVVKEALAASEAAPLHGMHDPTEGGLATGLRELAVAAGLGLRVEAEAIHCYDESQQLCDAFGLDPLGLIASGALLIAVPEADGERVVTALEAEGTACRRIGTLMPREYGMKLLRKGKLVDLPVFAVDEIARIGET